MQVGFWTMKSFTYERWYRDVEAGLGAEFTEDEEPEYPEPAGDEPAEGAPAAVGIAAGS